MEFFRKGRETSYKKKAEGSLQVIIGTKNSAVKYFRESVSRSPCIQSFHE